ncbi:TetR family transcriptional regulator [Nocardioides sp. Bht2]|uniref:TetR family transcriptional regulator n=1 Tax=Nocardioides sp. Bht2 TaxID=3392297 RepID=UPI0039B666C2
MSETDAEARRNQEQAVRATDGRVPKRRGLATRQRLLDATRTELGKRAYRFLTVADIAREAETSPSTFYQYFPRIDLAIFELAQEVIRDKSRLTVIVQDASWTGADSRAAARRLAEEFLSFWEEHRAVLKAVDILMGEGDDRFYEARVSVLSELSSAFEAQVEEGGVDLAPPGDAKAVGAVLVSMLAHVAAFEPGLTSRGYSREALESVMADIIASMMQGGTNAHTT